MRLRALEQRGHLLADKDLLSMYESRRARKSQCNIALNPTESTPGILQGVDLNTTAGYSPGVQMPMSTTLYQNQYVAHITH